MIQVFSASHGSFFRKQMSGEHIMCSLFWFVVGKPSLLKRSNWRTLTEFIHFCRVVHHLWTFWIQAEYVDHHNLQFHGDFSILNHRPFCCEGRCIQRESLCRPFFHVYHATVFIFHLLYMWVGNIVSICADENIADEMATETNGAGCNQQQRASSLHIDVKKSEPTVFQY